MRRFLYFCLLCFTVTLALVIGWRLSDQAMAVIVGVVAGVAASVPTSLLVVWLALRYRAEVQPAANFSAPAAEAVPAAPPQIIFVQSGPGPAAPPPAQRSLTMLPAYASPQPTALNGLPLGPRQFTILGGEDTTTNW